jgi:hypothetical protein
LKLEEQNEKCVSYPRWGTVKSKYQTLIQQYLDTDAQLKQLFKVLGDIEDVGGHIPASVGKSA